MSSAIARSAKIYPFALGDRPAMASWHADFLVGDWRVSPKLNQISKDSQTIGVKHKSMEVLVCLADANGEVVDRNDIMDAVWPGMTVTDDVLTQSIVELRKAFDDDARHPRVIETISRVGFRLIAAITPVSVEAGAAPRVSTDAPRTVRNYLLAVIALLVIGIALWALFSRQEPPRHPVITVEKPPSIAVLPFDNISADPEQEYFVSGLHRTLIAELARISELNVTARTSVMQYQDTTLSVPEIARQLGVGTIIEGSVFKAGDQVRISAQLIDAGTDKHLWSQTFDRNLSDVLNLHKEVTREIAQQIEVTLTSEEQDRLASTSHVNPEAHRLYLQGQHIMDQPVREPIEKSIELYDAALAIEPEFALAHIGKAEAYLALVLYGFEPLSMAVPQARSAVEGALRSDPTLGEAYVVLGSIGWIEWDWATAERHYATALDLSPSNAAAHIQYANYLGTVGRFNEAIDLGRRVKELDPFSVPNNIDRGYLYYYARRFDEALAVFNEVLEMRPTATQANLARGLTYLHLGRYEDALQDLNRCLSCPWALSLAYAASGRADEAEMIIDSYLDRMATEFIWTAVIALQYAAIGDNDEAFKWLEKTYENREYWLQYLLVDALYDPLRGDPRFDDLVSRMNFPQSR